MRKVRARPWTATPEPRGREARRMILRGGVVVLLALLLAVQVVRNSAVLAFEARNPAAAVELWKGNPRARISLAMVDIARSAHDRRPVSPIPFAMLDDAAMKAPL